MSKEKLTILLEEKEIQALKRETVGAKKGKSCLKLAKSFIDLRNFTGLITI